MPNVLQLHLFMWFTTEILYLVRKVFNAYSSILMQFSAYLIPANYECVGIKKNILNKMSSSECF